MFFVADPDVELLVDFLFAVDDLLLTSAKLTEVLKTRKLKPREIYLWKKKPVEYSNKILLHLYQDSEDCQFSRKKTRDLRIYNQFAMNKEKL